MGCCLTRWRDPGVVRAGIFFLPENMFSSPCGRGGRSRGFLAVLFFYSAEGK